MFADDDVSMEVEEGELVIISRICCFSVAVKVPRIEIGLS